MDRYATDWLVLAVLSLGFAAAAPWVSISTASGVATWLGKLSWGNQGRGELSGPCLQMHCKKTLPRQLPRSPSCMSWFGWCRLSCNPAFIEAAALSYSYVLFACVKPTSNAVFCSISTPLMCYDCPLPWPNWGVVTHQHITPSAAKIATDLTALAAGWMHNSHMKCPCVLLLLQVLQVTSNSPSQILLSHMVVMGGNDGIMQLR